MIKGSKRPQLALPFASHPFSSLARTIIEKTRYKRVIVANVAFSAVLLNAVMASPSHAFDYKNLDSSLLTTPSTLVAKTESAYTFPVVEPTGLSQGYHSFHPGLDIRAPRGRQVLATADGTVIEVKHLKTGYGNHVRIAHAGTLSTLYAHLDKINVEVGQKVNKGQEIGTIGMTGWTTGPHLHFEMYEGVKAINPATMLGIK